MLPKAAHFVLSAFDLHLWPAPLTQTSSLPSSLGFLSTPAAYRAMRQAGTPVQTAGFMMFPMTPGAHEHFWYRYEQAITPLQLAANAGPIVDDHEWLMPLRCRPLVGLAPLQLPGLTIKAKAYVTVWLWTFGWSTQVEIRMLGPAAFSDLRAASASITRNSDKVFPLQGKALALPELFGKVAADLKRDLFAAGPAPPDILKVPRRCVMGCISASGEPYKAFANAPGVSQGRWSDSERADIASALTGKPVSLAEINGLGVQGNPFGFVPLRFSSYALTHDQQGALLMMPNARDVGGKRSSQMCMIANVRAGAITWAALTGLAGAKPASPAHQDLIAAGKEAAYELRQFYRNPVFQRMAQSAAIP